MNVAALLAALRRLTYRRPASTTITVTRVVGTPEPQPDTVVVTTQEPEPDTAAHRMARAAQG